MPTDLSGTPTSLGIGTYNVDVDAPSGLGFNAAMAQIDALLLSRTHETLTQNDKLALQLSGAAAGLTIGGDTNLYRSAASIIGSDGDLEVRIGTANRLRIGFVASAAAPGLQFGTAYDTNLYRLATNFLSTSSDFAARQGNTGQISLQSLTGTPYIFFSASQDTSLSRPVTGVLRTDGAFAHMGYGTSLPATPVDGHVYTLVDSTTAPTYQWTFRYNASSTSPYKWEFVGGAPARAENGGLATASTSYVDLSTPISITVPRAGDYAIQFGGHLYNSGSSGAVWLAPVKGATAAADADAAGIENLAIVNAVSVAKNSSAIGMAAAGVIKLQGRVVSGTGNFGECYLHVTPIRVA